MLEAIGGGDRIAAIAYGYVHGWKDADALERDLDEAFGLVHSRFSRGVDPLRSIFA